MPVPHFNIKITQRSKGKSAVAGAAYQAGEKLFSEYDQKTKNYTCKKEVVYTEIMLPPNAPPEYADRATLWNSVEEIEKQWNSQLARRFVAALPREVPMELLPQMVKEYCEEQFVSKGKLPPLSRRFLHCAWTAWGRRKLQNGSKKIKFFRLLLTATKTTCRQHLNGQLTLINGQQRR